MRACPKCGADYDEGKRFCKKCGTALIVTTPTKHCPDCRLEYEPDKKFCKKCGRPLDLGPLPSVSKTEDKSSSAAPENCAVQGAGHHLPAGCPPLSGLAAPDSPLSTPRVRPLYTVLVPITMWLYAVGLLVPAIMAFSVDGLLYFYDDEVRMGWAMLIGCIFSTVTGIVLWRRKPAAGVFVAAAILLLGLVPFLIGLFSLLNNL